MSAVSKKDLYRLIDQLPDNYAEKAFNILRSFIDKQTDKPTDGQVIAYFKALEQLEPDDLELSESELEQLQCNEYTSWDEFKRECGVLN